MPEPVKYISALRDGDVVTFRAHPWLDDDTVYTAKLSTGPGPDVRTRLVAYYEDITPEGFFDTGYPYVAVRTRNGRRAAYVRNLELVASAVDLDADFFDE